MSVRQFMRRVRRWARAEGLKTQFIASEGAGSHGTFYVGSRKTTVKDRKKRNRKGSAQQDARRPRH